MRCPVDPDVDLLMTDRQGVEIDYCPKCRGVWLDRGELDKIIDRSHTEVDRLLAEQAAEPDLPEWSSEYDERGRDRWRRESEPAAAGDDRTRDGGTGKKGKKKKSSAKRAFDLLDDLFDL